MATLHEPPRKKLATYGKVGRQRVAPTNKQYNTVFFGASSSSSSPQTEQVQKVVEIPLPQRRSESPNTAAEKVVLERREKPAKPAQRLPATSPQIDVFDVPDDDTPVIKVKRPIAKSTTKATTKPNLGRNVFDLPSDDDQIPNEAAKMQKNTLKSTIRTTRPVSSPLPRKATSDPIPQNAHLKRIRQPSSTVIAKVQKTSPKVSPARSAAKAAQLVSSNAVATVVKTAPISNTPRKLELSRAKDVPASSSANLSKPARTNKSNVPVQNTSTDMMDVDVKPRQISPKGLKLWKDLLESDADNNLSSSRNIGGANEKKPVVPVGRTLFKPARITKSPPKATAKAARKRLIDFLADQASSDSEEEVSGTDESDEMSGVEVEQLSQGKPSVVYSLVPEMTVQSGSNSQNSQVAGPKFVYGEKRTILADQDFMQTLQLEMSSTQDSTARRNRRGSIPTLPVLPSFHDADMDEEEGSNIMVRNVHELRQAGVNGRFLDELDDFFDRISTPGHGSLSMRRSGLLDLANKLNDKSFARQFRSNAAEERLFARVGEETDVVAGFMLVSMLLTLSAEGTLSPVVLQHQRQGITRLLLRLLGLQGSIVAISKDRKSNLSKIAQSLIGEHHQQLLQSSIWEQLKPEVVTPRTIALKCLEKMVRQTRQAGNSSDIFSKEVTRCLFDVLKSASDDSVWQSTASQQSIDFFLALSALESQAITTKSSSEDGVWVSEFLPIVANVLQMALSQPSFGEAQLLILRLALNVTNNNHKGADVFARPELLVVLGKVVISRFKQMSRFLSEEEFFVILDQLVLTLGVMINFAEWSTAAREALQGLEGRSDDPLDRMAQLFLDNRERMAEADSVEESQKNVPFGYLSVLMGYLALHPPIAARIRKRNPKHTLQPLVSSIEEFIMHHKAADNMIASDADGHNPHTGLTERLEVLVTNLRRVV